ncbi:hypothetical protein ACQ4LE_002589 [Meloidogyne hapla]|uniref:START domain-containing protein n=1 Tax=Meloidogyne hapla TaxID=6305 RepID=A0A1I8BLG0_MELHA
MSRKYSSLDIGQFYVFKCKDLNEVAALKKLFIGPEHARRWLPHNKSGNIEYYKCSGEENGCILRMIVSMGSLNYIKISKGDHYGHPASHDNAIANALHFVRSPNVMSAASGVGVPEE